ncbi:MAG: hypothetical protein ABGW99_08550 [Zunongwangia sp.]|uniref:hypothetical protein n=1 Tax=Zunongwangia sp. TaxID=1965325 RepID=UPI003241DB64
MNTQSVALKIMKKTIKTVSKKYKELPEERFWVQENRIENKIEVIGVDDMEIPLFIYYTNFNLLSVNC